MNPPQKPNYQNKIHRSPKLPEMPAINPMTTAPSKLVIKVQRGKLPTAGSRLYVPTDFDTIEKALSRAKAAEKGVK